MRDLLFKNLTSQDNRRKILASSEIVDKDGVRTIVRRHFVYFVREVKERPEPEQPFLAVIKEHNSKFKYERFYCRMKGSVLAMSNGRMFKVNFMHSLRICLTAIPEGSIKYSADDF